MADRRRARQAINDIREILSAVDALEAESTRLGKKAQATATVLRREIALVQMASIPLARLRETAKGLRLEAIERAGLRTVADILTAGVHSLRAMPGVGENTSRQAVAAARQVLEASAGTVRLHFDVVKRSPHQTELLIYLRRYDVARRALDDTDSVAAWLRSSSASILDVAVPASSSWLRRVFMTSSTKAKADEALGALQAMLADPRARHLGSVLISSSAEIDRRRAIDEIWADYEHHAAQLLGVLGEITGSDNDAANRGHLPADIVERVQAVTLDLTLLKAGLRGYQAFGTKFALAQDRAILGDEMGLGKTVEALGALCHLSATGERSSLVVCPASVVANWRAEVHRHTHLSAHVIHGPDRDRAHRSWQHQGGVAITTFDGLRRLDPSEPSDPFAPARPPIAMLVVDEAHYVKNPATRRSRSVARWAAHAARVLFLTGTPMENRVEEFQALVAHLQPDVSARVTATTALAGPAAFQAAVAPVYLRRNQVDVLAELPELIPSLDWVDPTMTDLATYRRAVETGTFMAMRRSAYLGVPPNGPTTVAEADRSAKLARLVDIVQEANEEGLKVVVFSYFRDVLAIVTRALTLVLPGAVYGPLTGSTYPAERQRVVEALATHPGGAVLVSQIEAGGVGLNIQAASVVVLCEPQWKPTTEAQAIARCHRMGQVRRVQVHRLLLEETVDPRMLAILVGKQDLIDRFVRGSAVKDATPDAIDISDLDKVEEVVNEAQAEALILASERRRLGIDIASNTAEPLTSAADP